jgi:hypothetical protein
MAAADIARNVTPGLAQYLAHYPRLALPAGAEEQLHCLQTVLLPKPTIQVWHATIQRRPALDVADVAVLSRQVLATHYVNGSLALTILTRAAPERYLVYVNWTSVDGLDGILSAIRRYFVERRVRSAARKAFETFKDRIELLALHLRCVHIDLGVEFAVAGRLAQSPAHRARHLENHSFDRHSLASLEPPTLALDRKDVKRSVRGLGEEAVLLRQPVDFKA